MAVIFLVLVIPGFIWGRIFYKKSVWHQNLCFIFLETNSNSDSTLTKYSYFIKKQTIQLTGFESDPSLDSKLSHDGLLAIKGGVGAHSQNLVLLDPINFQLINFQNGETSSNITSDVPNFGWDGNRFFGDVRDYDTDPINKAIRFFYRRQGDTLVFDKSVKISYDEIK